MIVITRELKAGGKILMQKMENDVFGFPAQFTDTEGNKIGFHTSN